MRNPAAVGQLTHDRDFATFRKYMEQAILERHILGDFDDHAGNFVIITDDSGYVQSVRNIDVEYALNESEKPILLRRANRNINNEIFSVLGNREISLHNLEQLNRFLTNPETRTHLKQHGFEDGNIDKMLVRAKFYVDRKHFPEPTGHVQ
jgi:hypothetical protein